jgi:hypothetical protein
LIKAQHPKKLGATHQSIEGRANPPKEVKKNDLMTSQMVHYGANGS